MGDIKAILRRHMNRRLYFALSRVKRSPSVVLQLAKNELAVRRANVRSEKPNTGPKYWFSGIDDETRLWLNTTGRRRHKAIARLLPEMPEVSIQESFTGSCGDSTLGKGFRAYRLFKSCYERHVGPIESCCSVLAFGCGWGRIIRFFLKDVEPEKVLGVHIPVFSILTPTRGNALDAAEGISSTSRAWRHVHRHYSFP